VGRACCPNKPRTESLPQLSLQYVDLVDYLGIAAEVSGLDVEGIADLVMPPAARMTWRRPSARLNDLLGALEGVLF
jgi:hypothetical protein